MKILIAALLAACSTQPPKPSPSAPPAPAGPVDPTCGMKTTDWCAAPPGDPCGAHKDTEACRADPKCVGMAYQGESVVACHLDARGFAANCPTVGCKSP